MTLPIFSQLSSLLHAISTIILIQNHQKYSQQLSPYSVGVTFINCINHQLNQRRHQNHSHYLAFSVSASQMQGANNVHLVPPALPQAASSFFPLITSYYVLATFPFPLKRWRKYSNLEVQKQCQLILLPLPKVLLTYSQ